MFAVLVAIGQTANEAELVERSTEIIMRGLEEAVRIIETQKEKESQVGGK